MFIIYKKRNADGPLFSYYLMKGLRGRADLNRDKRLTVKEIGKYLETNKILFQI